MILADVSLRDANARRVWTKRCSAVALFGVCLLLTACGGGGDAGGGTSSAAPSISVQPQPQTVATGSAATFSVTASGTAPLTYQWNKNGTAIGGATSSSYTTPATVLADSGASFTVTISNSMGQVTSSAASLTALDAAAITSQPQPQTVTTGDAATFSVTASGSALGYQWNKNGTPIAGATAASYTTPAVTLADSGEIFTVTVSNAASKVTSSGAALSANADPEGLYLGTLKYTLAGTTLPVFAIILKDGTAAAYVTDHVLAVNAPVGYSLHGLVVKPTGGNFSSSFTALLPSGYRFSNGEVTSSGTLSGTIVPGSSISGTFASDLDNGTFVLNAMTADYSRAASWPTIAGKYAYDSPYYIQPNGPEAIFQVVTVGNADGSSGSATSSNGCTSTSVVNTIPDPTHNAYSVTAHFACSYSPDVVFTALQAFFPAGTGAGIIGPSAFTGDTIVTITDDVVDQVAYMIIAAKQ
jgi:hypothetical protein